MRLFYYHKIFVQRKLLFPKLNDCQQTLCVCQLVSLLQHKNDSSSGGTSRRRPPGAELGSTGLSGKAPSTKHTAAWAGRAKRSSEAGCRATRSPPALFGSPRSPAPQPSAASPPPRLTRGPPPACLTRGRQPRGSPLSGPGTAGRQLPQHPLRRRARRAGEGWRRSARLLLWGGGRPRLSASAGLGTPRDALFPDAAPPPASPLDSAAAPLGARGTLPRHPAPHLASARHYSPVSVGSHSLPRPSPNSSAAPRCSARSPSSVRGCRAAPRSRPALGLGSLGTANRPAPSQPTARLPLPGVVEPGSEAGHRGDPSAGGAGQGERGD